MTRNQRIKTTAHHLRRIYQDGRVVALRIGAIKRHHAAAMAKIGQAIGGSWDAAVSIAKAMARTPALGELAMAGSNTGLRPIGAPARFDRLRADSRHGADDYWIEPTRAAMAGRAARSAGVRFVKRLCLVLLAGLCLAWLAGASK